MDQNTKYDDVLLSILQNCGKIEPFIDAIFHFLARRTDFFRLMHAPSDKLGFPPGIAEKVVLKMFRKHQAAVLKDDKIYQQKIKGQKHPFDKPEESSSSKKDTANRQAAAPSSKTNNESKTKKVKAEAKTEGYSPPQSPPTMTNSSSAVKSEPVVAEELEVASTSAPPKSEPVSSPPEEASSSTADIHNGADLGHYSWTQTLTDVDIRVPVPAGVRKSKQVKVSIESRGLNVQLTDNPPPDDPKFPSKQLMQGRLTYQVKIDDSLWSLVPGDSLQINLEKQEHRWWTCVLEGDSEIDKQKIDTTTHVHDFDDQTQADIRKVMYDQEQKMKGLPTSEEQKTYSMLEKAWDAEGSPFRGTPYDPSRVNIGNNGQLPNMPDMPGPGT